MDKSKHGKKRGRLHTKSRGYVLGSTLACAAAALAKTPPPVIDESISESPPPSDCPDFSKQFKPLSFNNGIWLGASNATVEKVFHSDLIRSGEHVFIGYQGKVADGGNCDGGYDLLNSLYLTFRAGLLVAIDAGQVTSC
jgi:hypothetical protein